MSTCDVVPRHPARPWTAAAQMARVLAGEEEDTAMLSKMETAQFAEDFALCPHLVGCCTFHVDPMLTPS